MQTVTVAAFDFDGTLTRRDTLLPYLRHSLGWGGLVRALLWSAPWLVAYALRLISNHAAKARLLKMGFAGCTVDQVERWSSAFVAHYLPTQWRADARAQLLAHQNAGHRCVIVSASTSLYMHHVGRLLGVETVLCTELEVQDGCYTGRMRTPNCYGDEKVRRLQAWMVAQGVDRAQTQLSAYGDTAGDVPMLRSADHAWYQGQPWADSFAPPMLRSVRSILVVVFALHFCVGAAIGLSADEAHYALYAAHLAMSYFDHPPMVGWVQWPLVALHAPDALLRLIPGLLWLGTAVMVYRLAERLRGPQIPPSHAGLWAVIALALSPLPHVLGIGLLPDTLLMALSTVLMWLTLDLMEVRALQRLLPWVALGIGLGLSGLSKYTAVFAAAAVAVCLFAAHGWRVLLRRGVWVAAAIALLLVLPVVVWNAQNQWVSFVYQAKHGAGNAWTLLHLAQFLVVQLLAYGPLVLWGFVGAGLAPTRAGRWMLLFFVVPFFIMALMAGGGSSLPHWTAPAWVALTPFAGMALARAWQRGRRTVVLVVGALQGAGCAALLGLMASGGVPWVSGPLNPFADLHGWDAAARRVGVLAQQNQLHSVSVQNWTLASRVGWYARPLPVHVLDTGFDQFDLWAGDLPAGSDTLLVEWSQMPFTLPVGESGFSDCRWLEEQKVARLGQVVADFQFYACRGWSGKPQPQRREVP
jgi:HAD superfamily hydrolase (TIGR01490 family)